MNFLSNNRADHSQNPAACGMLLLQMIPPMYLLGLALNRGKKMLKSKKLFRFPSWYMTKLVFPHKFTFLGPKFGGIYQRVLPEYNKKRALFLKGLSKPKRKKAHKFKKWLIYFFTYNCLFAAYRQKLDAYNTILAGGCTNATRKWGVRLKRKRKRKAFYRGCIFMAIFEGTFNLFSYLSQRVTPPPEDPFDEDEDDMYTPADVEHMKSLIDDVWPRYPMVPDEVYRHQ